MCAPALGIEVESHCVGGLGVLDPRLPAHPFGTSFDVLAPSVSLPRRFVGQASIAEVGRNSRAVTILDAGTGALQPCQPSVVALVPPVGLASDGAKR